MMAGHEDDELVLATMAHEGGYIRLGMSAGEPWRATGRSVRAFARTFEQDKETRYLVLMGSDIMDESMIRSISRAVSKNTSARVWRLTKCSFEADAAQAIAHCIAANSTLELLHLDNTFISEAGFCIIARAIGCPTCTLSKLQLDYCGLSHAGILQLAAALLTNTSLTALELEGNAIGDEGVAAISAALASNTSLTELTLIHEGIVEYGEGAIGEMLQINHSIKTLDLSRNCLAVGSLGAAWLAQCLEFNTTLESLNLSENEIDAHGCGILALFLFKSRVRHLSLGFNPIGDDGLRCLELCIRSMPPLESLSLSSIGMTEVGAASLAAILVDPRCKIKRLYIDGNKLGDKGAKTLGWAFNKSKSIELINVESNGFTDAGATALAWGVENNSSLRQFHYSTDRMLGWTHYIGECNTMGKHGAVAFANAIRVATKLEDMCLGIEYFPQAKIEGLVALGRALMETPRIEALNLEEVPICMVWEELGLPACCKDMCNHGISRVMLDRWREFLLTVAMGMHNRLGGGTPQTTPSCRRKTKTRSSCLYVLNDELFRLVAKAYWGAP